MKKIIFGIIIVFFMSCVHQEKKSTFLDPSERINDVIGISVLPPQEEGWRLITKDRAQLIIGKEGPLKNSSYIAITNIFKLPEFESEQQFVQYISKMKKKQQPEERFRVIQDKKESIRGGTNHIILYHSIAEDKIATEKNNGKTMLLEIIGYTGQHPKKHSIGFDLGYSFRYPMGAEDTNFKEKANAYLDQIIITDL